MDVRKVDGGAQVAPRAVSEGQDAFRAALAGAREANAKPLTVAINAFLAPVLKDLDQLRASQQTQDGPKAADPGRT